MRSVPFYIDTMTIIPHTASSALAHLIGKPVSLAEVSSHFHVDQGSLFDVGNGDLYFRDPRHPQSMFIEGQAIPAKSAHA